MKRLWKRKWWVIAATLVVFLSVGAVAWAATDQGQAADLGTGVVEDTDIVDVTQPGACIRQALGEAGSEIREAMREGREQRLKNRAERMEALREEMTPEDQALFDQLVETAKDKRETLQEAREDLASTLKELRELAKKYLDGQS